MCCLIVILLKLSSEGVYVMFIEALTDLINRHSGQGYVVTKGHIQAEKNGLL